MQQIQILRGMLLNSLQSKQQYQKQSREYTVTKSTPNESQ